MRRAHLLEQPQATKVLKVSEKSVFEELMHLYLQLTAAPFDDVPEVMV